MLPDWHRRMGIVEEDMIECARTRRAGGGAVGEGAMGEGASRLGISLHGH